MPPRTYEEAIRSDRELMRLNAEIEYLESQAGRNPSEVVLARLEGVQRQREARHDAILWQIEEEKRSAEAKAEAKSCAAEYSAHPGASEFAEYVQSLGKSVAAIAMLKSLFVNRYRLATQPKDIKEKMRWHLDAFSKELSEEQLAKYSAVIGEIVEATGDVDPEKFHPNPAARDAARDFTEFLKSIDVEVCTVYLFGDLFADCQDLVDQPEDIRKEMIAALDAFVQELTEEQLEKYCTVIDEVREAARTGTENEGKT